MTKKKETEELSKLSYAELEKKAQLSLDTLGKDDLPLDEAKKVFDEGKNILDEMQKRLDVMQKEATDSIDDKSQAD